MKTSRIEVANADLPALNYLVGRILGFDVGVLTAQDIIAEQLVDAPQSRHATIHDLFSDAKPEPCLLRDDGWKHVVSMRLQSLTGHSKLEFCTNWGQTAPILVRHKISWREASPGIFHGVKLIPGGQDQPLQAAFDPLVASVRALVASALGDQVDVPVELAAPPAIDQPPPPRRSAPPQQPKPASCSLYKARLKTRRQMERDIPRAQLGWWHDVCPGQHLILRTATAEDLARCHLREGSSLDPADYLCETFEGGSLVLKAAIAQLTELPQSPAAPLKVDRVRSGLGNDATQRTHAAAEDSEDSAAEERILRREGPLMASRLLADYQLVRAEHVRAGDRVLFANGQSYAVEAVEEDRIGGVRHRFHNDTGSNCWQRGELCRVAKRERN